MIRGVAVEDDQVTVTLALPFIDVPVKDDLVRGVKEAVSGIDSTAQIEVELQLPEGSISVRGEVVFSNVPGNLQRPNLPMGMGVRFENLDPQIQKKILYYVEQRLTELKV